MQADLRAKELEQEEGKAETAKVTKEPEGLQTEREPVASWGCRSLDTLYKIETQVGEGAFRYSLQLHKQHGL